MGQQALAHGRSDTDKGLQFSIADYPIGVAAAAVVRGDDVALGGPDVPELIVVPAHREYYGEAAQWQEVAGRRDSLVKTTPLPPGRVHSLTATSRGKSLDDLLWMLGAAASRGRLADDLSRMDVFRLNRWPNATRLGLTHDEIRLAVLLSRYPSSIAVAAGHLRLGREVVNRFVTAAWCAGLAEPVNRAVPLPDADLARRGTLMSALLEMFRKGQGAP